MSDKGHKVLWFPPDRPVEGNTIYVRPAAEVSFQSRVWLAGDTVPEGVAVLVRDGYVIRPNSRPYRIASDGIEMPPMPAFGETVAKEKARRVVADAASIKESP